MKKQPYLLGIDAGGTSIRAALTKSGDQSQVEVNTVAAPDGGPEPLRALLPSLLRQADVQAGNVAAVCAGITKFTRADTAARWSDVLTELLPMSTVRLVPDYEIAFHGALPGGQGILVIAGTGSVAFAAHGTRTARVGGRGWEYGDEGSGAHLTTEAVRRTLRALDGMDAPTDLTKHVCLLMQTDDPALLGEQARQQALTKGRGFLVPHLLEQARLGDAEARNLYVGAGGWLAALVRAGLTQVGLAGGDAPSIALVGGLWEAGDFLTVPFARVVQRWYPGAHLVAASDGPLVGALRLAKRAAG